jgi:hypothetical protein
LTSDVGLTWSASSDPDNTPVAGYTIYMSRNGGPNGSFGSQIQVAITNPNTLSTTVVDVQPGFCESFQFTVVATDTVGNISLPSNTATVTSSCIG